MNDVKLMFVILTADACRPKMASMADDFPKKAGDVAVLHSAGSVMGIPTPLFFGCIAVFFPVCVMVSWVIGILAWVFALYVLYRVHREDPFAVEIWIARVTMYASTWSGGVKRDRSIIRIKD